MGVKVKVKVTYLSSLYSRKQKQYRIIQEISDKVTSVLIFIFYLISSFNLALTSGFLSLAR